MAVEIDYNDTSDIAEHSKRQAHLRALRRGRRGDLYGEGIHVHVDISGSRDGECPMCNGPATVHDRYDSALVVCHDYICWRTFGTLCV